MVLDGGGEDARARRQGGGQDVDRLSGVADEDGGALAGADESRDDVAGAFVRRRGDLRLRAGPAVNAAVTGVLLDLGGNVEDSRMAILGGHFAVMLIVELPEGAERERLDEGLAEVRERLGLGAVSVSEVESLGAGGGAPTHVLTVYGADRPGIVHGVAFVLAERGVNVTDLETRVTEAAEPVYVMVLELALGALAPAELEEALRAKATELEVDVSLRPLEAEQL